MTTCLEDDRHRFLAVEASRACARAEFARWSSVLRLRESLIAEIEANESAMFKRMAVNATALEIGQVLQLCEQQVWRITEQAPRLRDHVPSAWAAFAEGAIDAQRASTVAVAVDRLQEPTSMAAPKGAAVAIAKRLRLAAKTMTDLFVSWLTNATGTDCDIRAEVAIVVEATALAGVTDTPAHVIDPDDDIAVPADWVFDIAGSGSTLWTRLLTDPVGRVLDVTHLGYQPPESLRRAVQWRDMTCRIRGCHRRSDTTDLDHHVPYD